MPLSLLRVSAACIRVRCKTNKQTLTTLIAILLWVFFFFHKNENPLRISFG